MIRLGAAWGLFPAVVYAAVKLLQAKALRQGKQRERQYENMEIYKAAGLFSSAGSAEPVGFLEEVRTLLIGSYEFDEQQVGWILKRAEALAANSPDNEGRYRAFLEAVNEVSDGQTYQ